MGSFVSVSVEASEKTTVKVGFYKMSGFQYYDEEGKPQGYNVDYLKLIAHFNEWEYEYVEYETFDDALIGLKNKEIDILAPVLMSQERMKEFDYSSFSLGRGVYVLVANANTNTVVYEEFEKIEGAVVSVPRNYPITDELMEYMEYNNIEFEFVYYDTPEEAVRAMMKGEAEFSVTSLMAVDDKYDVIAKFDSSMMYYLTYKGNRAFLNELNSAMEQVQYTYTDELKKMEIEHFPAYGVQYFSSKEQNFINNCPTLNVGFIQGMVPLSFINEEDGSLDGISREIFDRIQQVSGLKFKYVPIPYGKIDEEFLSNSNLDILSGVEYNKSNLNNTYLKMSSPYITSQNVFVGREETDFNLEYNLKVAIPTGSKTREKVLQEKYPEFEFVIYNTVEDAFGAVKKRQADFVIVDQYIADYLMEKPLYSDFVIIPAENMEHKLCFSSVSFRTDGLTEEEQQLLIRILDKSIEAISSDDIESIVVAETVKHRYQMTIGDIFYKYRISFAIGGGAILILIAVFVYVILFNVKHAKIHKREATLMFIQKKRYQLVMDNSEDMIYEIGLMENVGVSSEKIKDVFGWEIPKSIPAITFDNVMKALHVHPDDVDRLYEKYAKNLTVTGIQSTVVQMEGRDGQFLWCELTVVPLVDEDENVISYVGKIKNINQSVIELQEKEQKLQSAVVENETLEELIGITVLDNLTDVLKISLKTWMCTLYDLVDGKITETVLDRNWEELYEYLLSFMSSEDKQRLSTVAKKKVLARANAGDVFTYHYKTHFDTYNRCFSDEFFYYTTRLNVSVVNGEKVIIITNIDDTDVMNREHKYTEQREQFTNKLIESQKFLVYAFSNTYVTTFKIFLDNGDVYGFNTDEQGMIEAVDFNVKWDDFCKNEMLPYLFEEDRKLFEEQCSVAALNNMNKSSHIGINFKAKLDAVKFEPCDEYNWYTMNFRLFEHEGRPIATVLLLCNSDNVREEVVKNKSREIELRKKRIHALVDDVDDVVYELDLKDGTCFIAGSDKNTFGWNLNRSIKNITVENLQALWGVHPEDRFKIGEAAQTILKKKIALTKSVRVQKSDGTYVWCKISAIPILEGNDIAFLICKLTNVHDNVIEKLHYESNDRVDELTGLITENTFSNIVSKYLNDHSAKNDAFILIDLDHFKLVNESFDTKLGDKVIKDTARKLQIIFSNYDYIGKFNADEFGVYVKNIPAETLEDKLEWALEKLKDSYSYGGKIVEVSVSIGVAYCQIDKAEYNELYNKAASAENEAKKSGRGRYVIKRFF